MPVPLLGWRPGKETLIAYRYSVSGLLQICCGIRICQFVVAEDTHQVVQCNFGRKQLTMKDALVHRISKQWLKATTSNSADHCKVLFASSS